MWFLWLVPSNMVPRKHEQAGAGLRRGWPVDTQRQDGFGRRLPLGEKEDGGLADGGCGMRQEDREIVP